MTRFLPPLLLLFLAACSNKQEAPALFRLRTDTGISFTNSVANTADFNIFTYRNFYNGGGVAIGDLNNDSLPDVFFTANTTPNKLFLNKGGWKFEDISAKSGLKHSGKWATGAALADINSDGWLDIYICYAGFQKGISQENELYINNRNGTFTESAAQYGLAETGYTTHAAFLDYDRDGDLDCYLLKNSFIPVNTLNYANKRELRAEDWPVADFLKGGGDKLLQNEGGKFRDVSEAAGIYGSLIGFGLGVTVGDVNGDRWPDLYISNDFFERDYLYINQQDGTFTEELEQRTGHISHSSMGADLADIDNDGAADLFVTEMLPDSDERLKTTSSFENIEIQRMKEQSGFYHQYMQNTLQWNDGTGNFREVAHYSGVAASDWSWGGLMFDADGDTRNDIFVSNGIYHDVTNQDFIEFFANDIIQNMAMTGQKGDVEGIISKMPTQPIANKAFHNRGDLRFEDAAAAWGLDQPSFSNGSAYGDLDRDGDPDLVVNNVNGPSFVYENRSREQQGHHYVAFMLSGKAPNTFEVGSTVQVFLKGGTQLMRELQPSRGFQSSVDYRLLFGLGNHTDIDSARVLWSDGSYTTVRQPLADRTHYIRHEAGALPFTRPADTTAPLLQPVTGTPFLPHKENEYNDFYAERNLPMQLSRTGPASAAADVNGDGLTDLFIGGAADEPAHLYLQSANGYRLMPVPDFARTASFEDVCASFFDADGDGDPDLMVGSGGNHQPPMAPDYLARLYRNDGKGGFTLDPEALPPFGFNTGALAPGDADGDGDLDLFIGSRSIPQNYGPTPPSYLWINNGKGKFSDGTAALGPDLSRAGLVTAALWVDLTGDGRAELVVTGEWAGPQLFSYNGKAYSKMKHSLESLTGWWESAAAADLDGDGDPDLVLGNRGDNFYLHPDSARPVKLFMKDFDGNETVDKIWTRTVHGSDRPVFLKRELTEQIASLRKQNLKYADFASKTVEDLFGDGLKGSEVKEIRHNRSVIAWNEGGGKFTIQPLPLSVQLSNLAAICVADVDESGTPDLLLGGNSFGWLPQFSRQDASFGQVLLNRGGRRFEPLSPVRSGLRLRGELRHILPLQTGGGPRYLFIENNAAPLMMRPSR